MSFSIELEQSLKQAVWTHLLPEVCKTEQAAFLFAEVIPEGDAVKFRVKDIYFCQPEDFAIQRIDFFELTDAARINIIKRAHQSNTLIIEAHSHPFPGMFAASFSLADAMGFNETVPHLWWRLKNRPYAAIVVAPAGFDGLVWYDNPHTAEQLAGIQTDQDFYPATGLTLGDSHGNRTRSV